jgi:phosphoribosyl-AMP cyclohydrolase
MSDTVAFDPATLRFDAAGLIPCIAQEAETGEVLMMAWMNADAVAKRWRRAA